MGVAPKIAKLTSCTLPPELCFKGQWTVAPPVRSGKLPANDAAYSVTLECYPPEALAELGRQALVASAVDVSEAVASPERFARLRKRLQELQRQGLIRWGGEWLRPIEPVVVIHDGETIADIVIRDRQ